MVRHFLDLDGARVLPTAGLQLVEQAVADVLDTNAMGVVHGPAGLGKTFAVERALSGARAVGCWSSFPSRPTMRLVAASLFQQLTGSPAGRGSRFVLMDAILEELATRSRVVVVDEAQRLNTECIEFLRHLHDHPRTRFALAARSPASGCAATVRPWPGSRCAPTTSATSSSSAPTSSPPPCSPSSPHCRANCG